MKSFTEELYKFGGLVCLGLFWVFFKDTPTGNLEYVFSF